MDQLLTKDDTKVMKAIAIILMLIHHLWGFPERIAGGKLRYCFHILTRLQEDLCKHNLLNPFMDILIWGIITFMRQIEPGESLDIIYVPFMIVTAMDLLDRLQGVKHILVHIGRESTNMWLIHSFFCYYFYNVARIVVAPRWAIPSLLVLFAFTDIASILVSYFWSRVEVHYKRCVRMIK